MTCRTQYDNNVRRLPQRHRSWWIHSEILDETPERVGNRRRWIERRKEREYLFGGSNSYSHAIKEECKVIVVSGREQGFDRPLA
jgi:hypothetical protein